MIGAGVEAPQLSILDLSDRASQPMASADGKLVITFNGEIYRPAPASGITRTALVDRRPGSLVGEGAR
jgi:hypothetical protein